MGTTLGQKIRRARLEAGLTQDRLAFSVGVGSRTPQRWESGESEPQARHLAKIVEVTGKSAEFFLEPEEEPDLFARLAADLRELARAEVARQLRNKEAIR